MAWVFEVDDRRVNSVEAGLDDLQKWTEMAQRADRFFIFWMQRRA
jgi:hypothetical protein